jgi:hypothetical protein
MKMKIQAAMEGDEEFFPVHKFLVEVSADSQIPWHVHLPNRGLLVDLNIVAAFFFRYYIGCAAPNSSVANSIRSA